MPGVRYVPPGSIYTSGHIEIKRLFYRFRLIILTKMLFYVSNMIKNHVLMNNNPPNAKDVKSNFRSYGHDHPKIWVAMFQGPFFTYLDRSFIGVLTQVSGHAMLRKHEFITFVTRIFIGNDVENLRH